MRTPLAKRAAWPFEGMHYIIKAMQGHPPHDLRPSSSAWVDAVKLILTLLVYQTAYKTTITTLTMKLAFATPSTALVALTCMLHSSAALPASSSVLQRREATGTVTPMCYTVDKEQDGVKSVEYKLSVAWPTLVEPKAPSTVRKSSATCFRAPLQQMVAQIRSKQRSDTAV